jgi:hypothetical protein
MNSANRDHKSTVLLTTSNAPTIEMGQATTALCEDSLDGPLYRSETSTEREFRPYSMPVEGARPIPCTVERQSPGSGESFALLDTPNIAFNQERALGLELRSDFESDANTDLMDKSFQALKITRHSSGSQHQAQTKLGNWAWEAGSCICSLAIFLGMVGLLRAFDGKAQPDWPYGITLNSAVSFMVTMIKGFLLVPAAA